MAIDENHASSAAYYRFAEEMDPDMVQVQVDNGKPRGLESIKVWIITNWRMVLGIVIAVLLFSIGVIIGHTIVTHPIRTTGGGVCQCLTNNSASPPKRPQLHVTELFQSYVDADNLKGYFQKFTSGVHYSGSTGSNGLAAYIAEEWTKYGLDVHKKNYRVTLSRPDMDNPNRIEVFSKLTGEIQVNRGSIPDDINNAAGMLKPFNPYSATNTSLEGDPFYVNYGRLEDFQFIKANMRATMTAKGNICIAKMGVIPLSRLVANCQAEGAIAVVAFPDQSLYAQGGKDVYPKNWWLPLAGTIRDTARNTYGDPGSLFYPSFDDDSSSSGPSASVKDAVPSIPVQVIGYDDANGILRDMSNPKAPEHFHANISHGTDWFMGPGIHGEYSMRLVVSTNNTQEKITDVIGIIKGSIEPDRYVIVGNHRDSLTFGGVEPGTGSACLMELARALGELMKQGWKPRRTIILASWDAGEEGHIGSTEWVEEHLEILHEKAVAYINLDEAVSGTHTFAAEGSQLLAHVLYQATQKIACPDPGHTNMQIYENWSQKRPTSATNSKPRLDPPGTTSDLTPFLHLAGVPSVDIKYTYNENMYQNPVPTYPIMHTGYDDSDYVMNQVDPDFAIHSAVTKVAGEILLELVDATLLPVKVHHYSDALLGYASELSALYTYTPSSVQLGLLTEAAREFDRAAEHFQTRVDVTNVSLPLELRNINDQLMAVERAFLRHGGMTLQEQQLRHVVYGASIAHPYRGVAFPMLANNLLTANVTGDWSQVNKHLPHLVTMIRVAAKVLDNTDAL